MHTCFLTNRKNRKFRIVSRLILWKISKISKNSKKTIDWKEENEQSKYWEIIIPFQKWCNLFEVCIINKNVDTFYKMLHLLIIKYILLLLLLIIFTIIYIYSHKLLIIVISILFYIGIIFFILSIIIHFIMGGDCVILPTWDSFLLISTLIMILFIITVCYFNTNDKDIVIHLWFTIIGPIALYLFYIFVKSIEIKNINLLVKNGSYPVISGHTTNSTCACVSSLIKPPHPIKLLYS